MALLEVHSLTKSFASVVAVDNVSFELEQNVIMGMIGPNGAGKSTVFKMINGLYSSTSGEVLFEGKNITNFAPENICKAGIAMTSQTTMPFMELTVLQSVMVGSYMHYSNSRMAREDAYNVLEYIGLADSWSKKLCDCNIADRKQVELARALATRPKLLLLDELMAGLNPQEVTLLLDKIREIRDTKNITILFVEHLMHAVMAISETLIVLDHGELIATGTPQEVSQNEQVIEAYLGKNYRATS